MENKRMPKLRFPDFVEIQPFIKFKEIVESNIYGPRFNANDYNKSGNVKTIRGTDVSANGEFKYKQVPVAQLDKSTIENHRLRDGDLVMITTADCGLTGVFREQEIDYVSSAYGVRIRLNAKGNPYYFKYFFQTRHAKKEVASFVRKATVANLPGSDILRIRLNIPTLPEQTRIATFLTAVDKRIHLLQKKKAELEQYKKGVMQKLFSQTIRFKDEHGNDFPDWEEKKLEGLFNFSRGSALAKNDMSDIGENKCIHYGELFTLYDEAIDRVFSKTDIDGYRSKKGDILMPSSDVTPTGLARASAILKDNVIIGGDINVLRPKKTIDTLYISYLLNFSKNQIIRLVTGTTVKHIYNKDIKHLKFNLPRDEKEQQKIANFLSSIDKSIEKLSKQIEDSTLFKKGLLQKMFV